MNLIKEKKGRILIIVWKWQSQYLRKKGCWSVAGEANRKDFVYCISDKLDLVTCKKKVKQLIKELGHYNDFLIFLHRNQFFYSKTLKELLVEIKEGIGSTAINQKPKIKAFLFGDDRDYIYISTQNEGLLGAGGHFGLIKELGINVIEEGQLEKQALKSTHFEKVWRYYTYEFKKKIFNLKEELLLHFIAYKDTNEKIGANKLVEHLKKTPLLHLRIKSFIGKEVQELIKYEKEDHQSYVFDDCTENLQALYDSCAIEVYEKLVKKLKFLIYGGNKHQIVPKVYFEEIRDYFDELLDFMPESINY